MGDPVSDDELSAVTQALLAKRRAASGSDEEDEDDVSLGESIWDRLLYGRDDKEVEPPASPPRVVSWSSSDTHDAARAEAADAALDITCVVPEGYRRDRSGGWWYVDGGRVPGARDITLDTLYDFGRGRGSYVLVPTRLARIRPELAWVSAHAEGSDLGPLGDECYRVPRRSWQLRSRLPLGMVAPELMPGFALSVSDVAALRLVNDATVMSEVSRKRFVAPCARVGGSPVWSMGVVRRFLPTRRGQGWRRRRPEPTKKARSRR